MTKGKFITIEGGEGAGKSSNLDFIKALLEKSGKSVVFTREPGGTSLGEDLRTLLLDHKRNAMDPDTELMLMFAARCQHLHEKILPALDAGQWVLCDRFTDATYAYQGGGRGIDADKIRQLETWVQGTLKPNLTLLLDLPVETGLERAGQRSAPDRFEREKTVFFDKVRSAYLDIAHAEPERIKIINAEKPLTEVQKQIKSVVMDFLNQ